MCIGLHWLACKKSRAGLSLLGYCYFYVQDYVNASDCYEQLTILYPEQEQYKLYYSQALYKCGLFQESIKAASQIETPEIRAKVIYRLESKFDTNQNQSITKANVILCLKVNKLKAAIKYAEGDMKSCTVKYVSFLYACDSNIKKLNSNSIFNLIELITVCKFDFMCVFCWIFRNLSTHQQDLMIQV